MARSSNGKSRFFGGNLSPISRNKSHSTTSIGRRNYSLYINKILKEVVPCRSISSSTVDFLNTLINETFAMIAVEARQLMNYRKRCTLTPEDIQKAVYLLLPKKLARYAVAFGSEAVHRFVHS
ncbi:PREDICTED: histone H2B subacrosomal variant-like [Dipodomys ordii]|uniref:Histone H2B subacrosomal variant-like n=1 Tax=Dipodomys ordii TaxID=10020 RepID=A0A1S3FXD0_DIPOR|nr:PREDICTED: histone H2B subacrosomal variant-like [Dipodomys ordii]XP_012880679.1 PREDICTED: histone H2B subacrosomal variant-like [Dipodomys ordii]XP_042546647.1 histone H2B subacrosomal variant-like [Dipodomys spectabilis]